MSGKGGGGTHSNGAGGGGGGTIPAASRKMVQSLKEIVKDMSDAEIYATLKDCNMDPNEAVNRLLSQDPFHEVKKTKRDKKKDTTNTNTNTNTNDYSTRSRSSNSYGGPSSTARVTAPSRKPVPKKEHLNGMAPTPAYNLNATQPPPSSYRSTDSVGVFDGLSSSSSQHAPLQSPWMAANPGQPSMADIVKMGRPQPQASGNRSSNQQGWASSKVSETNHHDEWPSIEHQSAGHEWPSVEHQSAGHEWPSVEHQSAVNEWESTEHQPATHEWPSVEHQSSVNEWESTEHQPAVPGWPSVEHHQPAVSLSSAVDAAPNSKYYTNSSNFGEENWQQKTYDNEYVDEETAFENPDNVGSAINKPEDNPESASAFDGNLYQDVNSHQPHQHHFDHNEAEAGVSSVAANFEQLNLHSEDQGTEPEEDSPSVVIPDHLQLHTPECFNLSFGSFGSVNNAAPSESEPHASRPLKNNLEDTSEAPDVSIIGSSDARNAGYYGDEHLTTSDGNLVHRTGVSAGTYEHSSISQAEALKSGPPETAQENQYSHPSASHVYTYENAQQADVTFPHSQARSQKQDLSPFSNVMQAYTNSLPSALLDSNVQMAREDIPYSPFPAQQSVPSKYSNIASSIGGPSINMAEDLRTNSISTPQPNQQALPGANVATGPALPQHLAVHPYSQPTLPLGHYANMMGYPFLPQSYTYMPSAFQQAFAQNSTYHQSLAALLPQYKNSISVSNLPQSATVASGYGFGSSANIPGGNFSLNPPAAPTSTTVGYDDILNSHYKDNSHMISLQQQQNENSPMWIHGHGSRTMSAVPQSAYYSIQGQNQQASGFRQSQQQQQQQQQLQQPSQHFGPLGYPNLYHSQAGISLELLQQQQQQQNPREASLAGSQSQPSKQSQHLWQNSY